MLHQGPGVKTAVLKYFPVRPEGHGGAVFLAGTGTLNTDRAKGNAPLIALDIRIPILVHLYFQAAGKGIDNRGPNTVEAS